MSESTSQVHPDLQTPNSVLPITPAFVPPPTPENFNTQNPPNATGHISDVLGDGLNDDNDETLDYVPGRISNDIAGKVVGYYVIAKFRVSPTTYWHSKLTDFGEFQSFFGNHDLISLATGGSIPPAVSSSDPFTAGIALAWSSVKQELQTYMREADPVALMDRAPTVCTVQARVATLHPVEPHNLHHFRNLTAKLGCPAQIEVPGQPQRVNPNRALFDQHYHTNDVLLMHYEPFQNQPGFFALGMIVGSITQQFEVVLSCLQDSTASGESRWVPWAMLANADRDRLLRPVDITERTGTRGNVYPHSEYRNVKIVRLYEGSDLSRSIRCISSRSDLGNAFISAPLTARVPYLTPTVINAFAGYVEHYLPWLNMSTPERRVDFARILLSLLSGQNANLYISGVAGAGKSSLLLAIVATWLWGDSFAAYIQRRNEEQGLANMGYRWNVGGETIDLTPFTTDRFFLLTDTRVQSADLAGRFAAILTSPAFGEYPHRFMIHSTTLDSIDPATRYHSDWCRSVVLAAPFIHYILGTKRVQYAEACQKLKEAKDRLAAAPRGNPSQLAKNDVAKAEPLVAHLHEELDAIEAAMKCDHFDTFLATADNVNSHRKFIRACAAFKYSKHDAFVRVISRWEAPAGGEEQATDFRIVRRADLEALKAKALIVEHSVEEIWDQQAHWGDLHHSFGLSMPNADTPFLIWARIVTRIVIATDGHYRTNLVGLFNTGRDVVALDEGVRTDMCTQAAILSPHRCSVTAGDHRQNGPFQPGTERDLAGEHQGSGFMDSVLQLIEASPDLRIQHQVVHLRLNDVLEEAVNTVFYGDEMDTVEGAHRRGPAFRSGSLTDGLVVVNVAGACEVTSASSFYNPMERDVAIMLANHIHDLECLIIDAKQEKGIHDVSYSDFLFQTPYSAGVADIKVNLDKLAALDQGHFPQLEFEGNSAQEDQRGRALGEWYRATLTATGQAVQGLESAYNFVTPIRSDILGSSFPPGSPVSYGMLKDKKWRRHLCTAMTRGRRGSHLIGNVEFFRASPCEEGPNPAAQLADIAKMRGSYFDITSLAQLQTIMDAEFKHAQDCISRGQFSLDTLPFEESAI